MAALSTMTPGCSSPSGLQPGPAVRRVVSGLRPGKSGDVLCTRGHGSRMSDRRADAQKLGARGRAIAVLGGNSKQEAVCHQKRTEPLCRVSGGGVNGRQHDGDPFCQSGTERIRDEDRFRAREASCRAPGTVTSTVLAMPANPMLKTSSWTKATRFGGDSPSVISSIAELTDSRRGTGWEASCLPAKQRLRQSRSDVRLPADTGTLEDVV